MATTSERPDRYGVFTRQSVRVRGGFASPEAATQWLTDYPMLRLLDAEGREVDRVATAFEADLRRAADPTLTAVPVPATDYVVCRDVR